MKNVFQLLLGVQQLNADKVSALVLYYFIAYALLLLRVHMSDFLIDKMICKLHFQFNFIKSMELYHM